MTKGDIDRLGEEIGASSQVSKENLAKLQEYRQTFQEPIAQVFGFVLKAARKIDKQCIVTFRIKRIDTIIEKLRRFKDNPNGKMKLSRMWDIAGCRCILNSSDNEKLYREFKAKVAMEALQEKLTLTELSKKYDVHPNQITKWKSQLLEHGSSVYKDSKDESESDKDKLIAELYKTIGSLTMDVEFLKKSSRYDAAAELSEHHDKQLVPAGEVLHIIVALVLANVVR